MLDQLTKTVKLQIVAFAVIAFIAIVTVGVGYVGLPAMLFGIGYYTVTLELRESGNLYPTANVTYRGTDVGKVESIGLTPQGVWAKLRLDSGVKIPSNLDAEVHSQTAVGEQYVALLPRDGGSAPLHDGDVISADRTTVPPNLNALLDATNRGLQAIPNDNVRTVIDESFVAFGGLGPEFSRFVNSSTRLAIDARKNIGDLQGLIDGAAPVLESQSETSGDIQSWSAHLATVTDELRDHDGELSNLLRQAGPVADQARQLIDRVNPTLPLLLANLVSVGQVALTYQDSIEQLLVLMPIGVADVQGTMMGTYNQRQKYKGFNLSFNTLNINLPPPCTTGFLPAQQRRSPTAEDAPERPAGDIYCRRPQDSIWNVRGARNVPCPGKPGKRAPTAKLCESDDQYVPLNDGMNWKGDPNATLSGQPVPQLAPATPAAPPAAAPLVPALAVAVYDPATGTYVGPDGNTYTQGNLAPSPSKEQTWQSMLVPAGS